MAVPRSAHPAYAARLAGDPLSTMTGPPTAGHHLLTTANYNPAADPGGASGRRWGDYLFTMVDPARRHDRLYGGGIQPGAESYAVSVGKLAALPPATPTCAGSPITFAGPTGNVVINATRAAVGLAIRASNLPAPALLFTT